MEDSGEEEEERDSLPSSMKSLALQKRQEKVSDEDENNGM